MNLTANDLKISSWKKRNTGKNTVTLFELFSKSNTNLKLGEAICHGDITTISASVGVNNFCGLYSVTIPFTTEIKSIHEIWETQMNLMLKEHIPSLASFEETKVILEKRKKL